MNDYFELYLDSEAQEPVDHIEIGEVVLAVERDMGEGAALAIHARNTSGRTLRDLELTLDGDGADHVRLATSSESGGPNPFAVVGGGIYLGEYIAPDEVISFWAQGLFTVEDAPGYFPFEFVFSGTAIG